MGIPGADLMEVPTIYKALFLGLWLRGYTPPTWPEKWFSTSILGIPIDFIFALPFMCKI